MPAALRLRRPSARFCRTAVATLVALVGLAFITLGPAVIVLWWHERTESQAQEQTARHHLGMPVDDGPVTFVLHEVRCGPDSESTHGQRCEATLGVRNSGSGNLKVPASAQRIRTAEGARHHATNSDSEVLGALAPAQATTAVLLFDIPQRATVTHLEVRRTAYSRGVQIDLGGPPLPLLN